MASLTDLERACRRRRRRRQQLQRRLALIVCGAAAFLLAALANGGETAPTLLSQPTVAPRPKAQVAPRPKAQVAPRPKAPVARPVMRCPLPSQLRPLFVAAKEDTGLPLALLIAVAYVESRFEGGAESPVGAYGLMQLMPETAAALGVDPAKLDENVLGGARYLHGMLHRFDSLELALAAYNAGPTIVARVGGAPSKETRDYVFAVSSHYREHRGCS